MERALRYIRCESSRSIRVDDGRELEWRCQCFCGRVRVVVGACELSGPTFGRYTDARQLVMAMTWWLYSVAEVWRGGHGLAQA